MQVDLPEALPSAAQPMTDQRMQVQLLTLPPAIDQNALAPDAPVQVQSSGKRPSRKSALTTIFKPASGRPAQAQLPIYARERTDEVQTLTPSAPVQTPPVLNLDTSRAVTSAELQRRKSPLAAAVDASQSENSQALQARAFARLAPGGSSIVSETIMADGSRLIKFSAGGCMRVVNPSSRNHDDIRKSVMQSC